MVVPSNILVEFLHSCQMLSNLDNKIRHKRYINIIFFLRKIAEVGKQVLIPVKFWLLRNGSWSLRGSIVTKRLFHEITSCGDITAILLLALTCSSVTRYQFRSTIRSIKLKDSKRLDLRCPLVDIRIKLNTSFFTSF